MRRFLFLLLTLATFAGLAYAHNGMVHVMGTVSSITSDNIVVKTTDGKTQAVLFAPSTKYLKGEAPAARQDVHVGQHVVIHATKKGDQLVDAEIKVGATSGTGSMHGMNGDMSGMKMPSAPKH